MTNKLTTINKVKDIFEVESQVLLIPNRTFNQILVYLTEIVSKANKKKRLIKYKRNSIDILLTGKKKELETRAEVI